MTVITSAEQFNVPDLFIDLTPTLGRRLLLKCEGLNLAGSVKLKAAMSMLDVAERAGTLIPGGHLVESSSGNLGVALAMASASRGYEFHCVTDTRCTPASLAMMRAFGAEVVVVSEPHPQTGLLGARLAAVSAMLQENPSWFWPNQYANEANWRGHYATTGPEILAGAGVPDVVFVGAGTCGTLIGVMRYLRDHSPSTRVVAVDSVGSVTFGTPAATRHIPGLGAGVRPPLLDPVEPDEVLLVEEAETVRAAKALARSGFLLGGSTGTVVAAAATWLARHGRDDILAVAIAPDLGERYLTTVHDDSWVRNRYGDEATRPARLGAQDGITRLDLRVPTPFEPAVDAAPATR
ncbi:2,3-diaminopropionate biosynthesis protein SbnA [Luteipulveratus sp. YIM 133132]|uniref:2,3-diaminopropionate biosynthesis protein SbnA n=1 Tax=Luteipulveratus flavus TaxID=3031728 RepID=A0ABT6C8G3_9MICO|nr:MULTISPECIES: 2,3-diaminopropionate biosynthesis protein SbnA [unclassified Luteipulveratus]MDE9365082.1 2,3-diaminopropionate biosynthesis protein SbnA [Luteipulveratus sp. YIM 133132]MDF8264582.1 2,3-diaminopropionate biosynthesis protein SbnA [Luteipulveratus sp. YIM 133296]